MYKVSQESKTFIYIKMDKYFKSEWTDLIPFGWHKLFAFVVNDKGSFPSVSALVETNSIKHVCRIKGFLKNKLIELNQNREGLTVLPYETNSGNKLDIIYLENTDPICAFQTNGTVSCFGHQIPKIVNLQIFV